MLSPLSDGGTQLHPHSTDNTVAAEINSHWFPLYGNRRYCTRAGTSSIEPASGAWQLGALLEGLRLSVSLHVALAGGGLLCWLGYGAGCPSQLCRRLLLLLLLLLLEALEVLLHYAGLRLNLRKHCNHHISGHEQDGSISADYPAWMGEQGHNSMNSAGREEEEKAATRYNSQQTHAG